MNTTFSQPSKRSFTVFGRTPFGHLVHVTETSQTSFAMANATGARLRLHLQLFLRSVHHETLYILFFFFFFAG